MFSDRIFRFALIFSLTVHGALLLTNSSLSIFSRPRPFQAEVRYIKPPPENKEVQRQHTVEPLLKSKLTMDKRTPPPYVDREAIFGKARQMSPRQALYARPAFPKSDSIAPKKRVTLPPVDMDTINNASYISYYQIVREKIRRAAYQNYSRTDTGEVYLSFIIASNGELKDVHLNDERSSASAYLQQIALRSMQESAPFPGFPKELDYQQLSFNVVISFEVE